MVACVEFISHKIHSAENLESTQVPPSEKNSVAALDFPLSRKSRALFMSEDAVSGSLVVKFNTAQELQPQIFLVATLLTIEI